MIQDTGLEKLCELANTKKEILEKTSKLITLNFTNENSEKRREELLKFSPEKNAKKIITIIFKH
ncbi:hypothetical protein PI23P_00895 [Polaribacter irgensii 23-P]|uniref:Uncharacterized protein n=1 Tax=Polaribacter irgensii 23-P TaxID=313594 RepID=A4C2B6_9FLAO|nr:hypothetical protein [Polaribacter irgensii]EAR11717.1 hypothetical protein PI23P_00895 [Polaribacter irgensii 23-P]